MKILALIGCTALLAACSHPAHSPTAASAPEDRVAEARAFSQNIIRDARLDQQRIAFELYELDLNKYQRAHGLRARLEREAEDLRHPERLPWHKLEHLP